MKNIRILAFAASTVTVGLLAACGTTSTPSVPDAQPFPREQQCADIQRPADPHNIIGNNWFKDDACDILNLNHPGAGVDADQAEKIVYDARMKMLLGKRDIAMLAIEGSKQLDHPSGVKTDFASVIAQRYSTVKDEVNDSRAALGGYAPEGFKVTIVKGDVPSASPGLAPKK
ncbi:putative lipoprotein [Mycobacteroides abscessus subsp. abscessus]|uniref:hypothetical protein n=1 Tax=Mycobacteroides abscessus TaxID=36809 RepID=UPI0009A64B29|nr:hypothetical protein [Mycobacteroides abscessus]MBN7388563.1 hypothetical protein [Mycobacteroides abscessus subsp. abscessus]MBN7414833.1 hypothetical protein [Mycobacteroides abscessus subsp. abscessus]MDO2961014.1 hypothetical protein [Mycobacteroides abscessus subsp. abscessus]MDO2994982.1 hypothetical protein [Mycobacteroides abscessus subsp. abscessus]MDO3064365.1 hypothetical protein [Mycobacteroides abscessus subsp. abscessus]